MGISIAVFPGMLEDGTKVVGMENRSGRCWKGRLD